MNQVTRSFFQRQKQEITLLFRSIPGSVLALFVVSVVGMNLLANKSLDIRFPPHAGQQCREEENQRHAKVHEDGKDGNLIRRFRTEMLRDHVHG